MSEKISSWQKAFITSYVNEKITERIKSLWLTEIETKILEIDDLYKRLFEWTDGKIAIKSSIDDSKSDFDTCLKDIESKKWSINLFHEKVFGKKNEEWLIVGWVDHKLDEQEIKFNTLYTKIEGLLPGATTTWLAKAYQDHKDSFFIPNIIWSVVFIISLVFIIGVAFWNFKEFTSIESALLSLISRFPFFFAAIWLALYSSSQQSQTKRLEQEYAHKEALAKSFEWYKREIENLWEDNEVKEILNKLISNVVEMTWYNPSETLDKKHEWVSPPLLDKIPSFSKKSE